MTQRVDGGVHIVALTWFGDDWFALDLSGGHAQLRGTRARTFPDDYRAGAQRGLDVLVPQQRGEVMLSEMGLGVGCESTAKGLSLMGPFTTERLNAREGWAFSVIQDGGTVVSF